MRKRTVTVPNGNSDVREMHFGLDVIVPTCGFLAAAFAAWISLRMDVQEIKTIQEQDSQHLLDVIRLEVSTHDEAKGYVTREQFNRREEGVK